MVNDRNHEDSSVVEALDALFHPRAVAVVGASGRRGNPFSRPLEYLASFGYEGSVFPINPQYHELAGVTCYPDLGSVPEPVDLALMMVPAKAAVDLLPEVAAAGARAAVVFASGFGETGEDGELLQRELVETGRAHGVRLIGPNCQGVLSTTAKMYGTFTAALENGPISAGCLAYVGQSGAVGGSILSLANERGIGIASWVSTGNQADLNSVDVARYLIDESDTSALAMYIESATDELAFLDLARRAAELDKPLIVLRSAVSAAGARAAASHTGAIIGDSAAFDATVAEYGVIEARDIDELIDVAHAATALPSLRGRRLGIVTTSGGAGSLAADRADEVGLVVGEFTDPAQASLAELVPSFGAVENPVDVTAQIFRTGVSDDFIEVCHRVESLDEVDGVLIALTLVTGDFATRTAEALAVLAASSKKPVAIAWGASREQTEDARRHLREQGIPVYDSVGDACRALAALRRTPPRPAGVAVPEVPTDMRALIDGLDEFVTEAVGRKLLTWAGIPVPRARLVGDRAEAEKSADEFDGPVVLKIQSASVLHKSDLGGVVLGVAREAIADAAEELLERFADVQPEGVLIQQMAPEGLEFIVGVTTTAGGIALVTAGLGGTATEIFRDTATTFAPIDSQRARDLICGTRASALLTGFRGDEPYGLDALAELVSRVSRLAVAVGPRLRELEINPVRVTHDAEHPVLALDFLMRLTTKETN
ncbi:acyl-CoA synthetase (NDP forming) [Nocardioides salarius]|uniref:Acyl-CoA synthetase (NDP forming) n=1 Tax=Nocardioides salarius TaxID=374513 RepID=A0ABS2MA59_9ACTN|nr:acetate--CoA ligase family protein [Nocardioides salarius]MBM7508068.1 acyl-CoA synthetase (NDP forming) [Nocardioides salarius]